LISTLSGALIGELVPLTLVGTEPLGVIDGRALDEALCVEPGSTLDDWLGAALREVLRAVLGPLVGLLIGDLVLRTPAVILSRALFVPSHVRGMVELLAGLVDGLGTDELRVRSMVGSSLVVADGSTA
jgi:hypothetical protein